MERTVLTRKIYQRLRDIAEGKEVPLPAVTSIPVASEGEPDVASARPLEEAAEAPAPPEQIGAQ